MIIGLSLHSSLLNRRVKQIERVTRPFQLNGMFGLCKYVSEYHASLPPEAK
jgi:hypothetical protein